MLNIQIYCHFTCEVCIWTFFAETFAFELWQKFQIRAKAYLQIPVQFTYRPVVYMQFQNQKADCAEMWWSYEFSKLHILNKQLHPKCRKPNQNVVCECFSYQQIRQKQVNLGFKFIFSLNSNMHLMLNWDYRTKLSNKVSSRDSCYSFILKHLHCSYRGVPLWRLAIFQQFDTINVKIRLTSYLRILLYWRINSQLMKTE